jgi:hypothetical protein
LKVRFEALAPDVPTAAPGGLARLAERGVSAFSRIQEPSVVPGFKQPLQVTLSTVAAVDALALGDGAWTAGGCAGA